MIVTTITDDGEPLTLHLCRQPREDLPTGPLDVGMGPMPCATLVLHEQVFAYFAESGRTLPTINGG